MHPFNVLKHGYSFPGLAPFLDKVAEEIGLSDPRMVAQARDSWHGKQIQSLLGQLPDMVAKAHAGIIDLESPLQALNQIKDIYESVFCLLEGSAAAIMEVISETELPHQEWLERSYWERFSEGSNDDIFEPKKKGRG